MDLQQVRNDLKQRLPQERYEHVLRVTATAVELAKEVGVSVEKAEIAGLFHDYAKFMDKEELHDLLKQDQEYDLYSQYHAELWHAPVGALLAKERYVVEDEDVLQAIRFHTTGRAGMSPLEKVIYIADLIEPGRKFPGIEDLRKRINGQSLEDQMTECIQHTLKFLVHQYAVIFPYSFDCYNEHVRRRKEQ
ncbi:bis(5'-nucleosyl)-tetraphosphatase (symmetrical) YqeK [Sporosarcina newyorkensis]|uniref:bis(5'-nucleosyl)-tetraphosphatase (symmetrical) n=1 Tax=Sporosarcina newyorkensis TaxID=759851 RepID=A0A1T4XET5_9BACL|nr:bis(5'-nucleosyl)-tetraphosphatase (symmetrical) YqeK [Sporosarcina newyorkensis]SKA87989.1 putative HD superfamily hydrolase of NAD metabolism [Sporosarcina newyorkensis]